ncbi:MAG: alkaline phosphatase D family protein [Saprospiraceae bacterium]|nr:alkaline phosphatase D family protein [Saprospiraceae bacterium]
MKYTCLWLMTMLFFHVDAQMATNLTGGPMVGYAATRESVVWVQTSGKADVKMKYWPKDFPSKANETSKVETKASHGFTAHLTATDLEPGTTYLYEIIINNKEIKARNEQQFKTLPIWKWRTDAPDFKFIAGSCFYINEEKYDRPGKGYGGEYDILGAMYKDKPDFMVWLGDNTYLREADWDSRSGVYHRYTHTRQVGELTPLLANTHHYAIWDDHDYGPNDSDRTYYGKQWTLDAFKDFWANPTYGAGDTEGITGAFSWSDADFFLMDNRWYRSPQSPSGQIMGEKQLQWLIDALRSSSARFKFVCIGGQILSTFAGFENYANYAVERRKLLDAIDQYKVEGVVFLTGDRHHSEISKWTGPSGIEVYDLTASPITSSASPHPEEPNENRVSGSMIGERNYAMIEVTGKGKKRSARISLRNKMGVELYSYELK